MSSRVLAVACVGLFIGTSAVAAPTNEVSGTCPGAVTLTTNGATANGMVAFITGTLGGSTTLAAGPCPGLVLDLGGITKRFSGPADAAGSKTLSPTVGAGACAFGGQWMDITTCTVSPAVSITPVCDVPEVTNGDVPPVAGPPFMPDPEAFTMWTWNSVKDGVRENFIIDDAAGPITVPASFILDFYDNVVAQTLMCSAWFDIDTAVANPGYTAVTRNVMGVPTMTAVTPFDAVSITLTEGFTDCGPLDPAGALGVGLGGTDDIRVFAQGVLLETGYNDVSADVEALIVGALGQMTWDMDWAPFVIGESIFNVENNVADTFDRTCELVDPVALLPVPPGPLSEHAFSTPLWLFGI